MSVCLNKPIALLAALTVLGSFWVGHVTAQNFTTLHSFGESSINSFGDYINSDGAAPECLVLSGAVLYGAAEVGGDWGKGSLFSINVDGSGFKVLHEFTGAINDGANPDGLIVSHNALFGTTVAGGNYGGGTVFAMNTDGTAFKVLHDFDGSGGGGNPSGHLVLSANTLFGTTEDGGGTLFAMNNDGTQFRTLHNFSGTNAGGYFYSSGLLASSNSLYGTTYDGGNWGSIFKANTDGTGFTNLLSFDITNHLVGPESLYLSGGFLYGTARLGNPIPAVFRVGTDGTGLVTLYTNGTIENLSVIGLSTNTLYCLSGFDLQASVLTLFAINCDGSGFTKLYGFSPSDISLVETPSVSLFSGSTFYGTTLHPLNLLANDRIFSISISPQLTLAPDGNNMVLTWLTNVAGFDYSGYILQSTTNVASQLWTTNLPPPVFVNGQYKVTIPMSGTQQFFRLSQSP